MNHVACTHLGLVFIANISIFFENHPWSLSKWLIPSHVKQYEHTLAYLSIHLLMDVNFSITKKYCSYYVFFLLERVHLS